MTEEYKPLQSSKISPDFDKFIEYIAFIKDLANDHGINTSEFVDEILHLGHRAKDIVGEEIKMLNLSYKADVAVVGDFSAGKSSFINSLIGKEICPVDSCATTSSVTKFIYAFDEKIVNKTDNEILTSQKYKDLVRHPQSGEAANKKYELEYYYPFSYLSNVNLYDTPGFSNSQDNGSDTELTKSYIKISDALLLVTDINQGSITDGILKIINEARTANANLKIYAILNKADKKSPSAGKKIKDEVIKTNSFLSGCYLYTCKPNDDMQNLVEDTKVAIFNNLMKIGKENYITQKLRLAKAKEQFQKDALAVFENISHYLQGFNERNLKIEIKDWTDIQAAYNQMADDVSQNPLETTVETGNEKTTLIFFADGYYHDLHILIDEQCLLEECEKVFEIVMEYMANDNIAKEMTEDEKTDFTNNFLVPNLHIFIKEILRLANNNEPLRILNIEDCTDKNELRKQKSEFKKLLKKFIIDNFEFFQSCINEAIEKYVEKVEQLHSKDSYHYKNTIEKIDSFIDFISSHDFKINDSFVFIDDAPIINEVIAKDSNDSFIQKITK